MVNTNMLGLAAAIGSALLFGVDGKEVDKQVPVASPVNHVRQVPTRRLYGGSDSGGEPTAPRIPIPSICEPGFESGDNGVLWTEGQCREFATDPNELGFSRFKVVNGVYPKGCFYKNDVAYWSQSDNLREISRPFDNGRKFRIYCETTFQPTEMPSTVEPTIPPSSSPPSSVEPTSYEPTKWKDDGWDKDGWDGDGNGYCLTKTGCHRRAKEMGVNFVIMTGNYHDTYGCYFVLKDNNMYWNGGGNKSDWTAKPNKGVRAYCDNDDWTDDGHKGDDWGGDDWENDAHPTMEPSWKDDGHKGGDDWAGDDWENDAHPTIEPTHDPSAWSNDGYGEPTGWKDDGYGGTLDPTGWTDDGYDDDDKDLKDDDTWTDDGYDDDDKGLKDDDTWTDDGYDDDDNGGDNSSGGGYSGGYIVTP